MTSGLLTSRAYSNQAPARWLLDYIYNQFCVIYGWWMALKFVKIIPQPTHPLAKPRLAAKPSLSSKNHPVKPRPQASKERMITAKIPRRKLYMTKSNLGFWCDPQNPDNLEGCVACFLFCDFWCYPALQQDGALEEDDCEDSGTSPGKSLKVNLSQESSDSSGSHLDSETLELPGGSPASSCDSDSPEEEEEEDWVCVATTR